MSSVTNSPGQRFRESVARAQAEKMALLLPGVPTAYCGLLAKSFGFEGIYLSGSGVAASSFGLPDLAVTTLNDVVEDAKRIISACELPLLVDIDTGFGTFLNISRSVSDLERIGAAGVHIEDQVLAKRCGHRAGKQIVDTQEMVDRIKAAVSARKDESFVIMARTDAMASEGLGGVIARALAYKDAGADMIFPEALTTLEQFSELSKRVGIPILANITENGRTPLFTAAELAESGVAIALYPLSAFRAMSLAASMVYEAIANEGSQKSVLDQMHTRQQVYDVLDYDKYEKQMDEMFGKRKQE